MLHNIKNSKKRIRSMKENTFSASQMPCELSIDEIARLGAQKMISIMLESEIESFVERHRHIVLADGRSAVVRNGYNKERPFTVSAGTVSLKVPRSRDRSGSGITFSSAIVPKYMRRSLALEEAIPLLHLLGVSTNDMLEGIEALLGTAVKGLSATNITRMKSIWKKEYDSWKTRELSDKEYCYVWADGIHFNTRFEDNRLCTLVLVGALPNGHKELIAVESGYRESAESWSYLLRDLRDRGMKPAKLCIGDGAMGLWKALKNVYPDTKWQRCWVHKTANILDKMPKGVQGKAKSMIHQIYRAENKKEALKAYDKFISFYSSKYPKATKCLEKDKDCLLTFYEFPADHWQHIRSTNVIESTFATVRNRTDRTRGHGTIETTLMMVYKLLDRASKRWRRLRGYNLLSKVINGTQFVDGIEFKKAA
jgi:transposase-like protein